MLLSRKTLKQLILLTSSRVFNILKLSTRMPFLPNITIYPTSYCNYNCVMCSAKWSSDIIRENLDFSLMNKILMECSHYLFKTHIHFIGYGEPLMYPHMKETLSLCKEYGLSYSITTNGYLLEKYIDDLIQTNCHAIHISIHGDAETHNQITNTKDGFQKTLQAIEKLSSKKKESGIQKPFISVNHVITNQNIEYLKSNLELLAAMPITSICFQHLIFSQTDLDERANFLLLDQEKIDKLREFMLFTENNTFPVNINFFPQIDIANLERYYMNKGADFPLKCILPWLSVRIYPDGEVRQCNIPFENLNQHTLKEIINNKKARDFRAAVRKKKFNNELCFRCCQKIYF